MAGFTQGHQSEGEEGREAGRTERQIPDRAPELWGSLGGVKRDFSGDPEETRTPSLQHLPPFCLSLTEVCAAGCSTPAFLVPPPGGFWVASG